MPARTRTPRHRWVDVGLDALTEGGPDAVRVEALAARLGVTKGGFYGHFADRPALLGAMLDEWERRCTDAVLAEVEAEGGDAVERLRRAGQLSHSPDQHRLDLVGARSTLMFSLAVARHFMVAHHPGRSTREAVSLAGELLLRKDPGR